MFIVFLHKLFLAFCIKLFYVQHYLKNCSLSFMRKLFSVHYLKICSLFSHKTPSEIVFSKFKRQIWMLFHVWISQQSNLFFCIDKICFYIDKIYFYRDAYTSHCIVDGMGYKFLRHTQLSYLEMNLPTYLLVLNKRTIKCKGD